MRKIFFEDSWNEEFSENGFVIRPMLSDDEVEQCRRVYEKNHPSEESSKYNTLEVNDHHHREEISAQLREILEKRIFSHVSGYKFIGVNFAVKKAFSQEEFPMHIDDDHCDRHKYLGLNCWVPLVEVEKSNGGLYIIPRSHLLPVTKSGIGSHFPYRQYRELLLEHAYFVEMKAGEALFFDDRLIHGSFSNHTGSDRIAMITGMIPTEADFIMYFNHKDIGDHQLELFQVDSKILHELKIGERPTGYKSLGVFDQKYPELSESEMLDFVGDRVDA